MIKRKHALRTLDLPLYSYWQALYMSFYASRLYVDVAKRWRGYGFRYLFLVMVIAVIPLAGRFAYQFDQSFKARITEPVERLPPLFVRNGLVEFDKPMPFLVKNDQGDVIAMIDTTRQRKGFPVKYPSLNILVTKDTLFFRVPAVTQSEDDANQSIYEQRIGKETNEVFVGKDWIASSHVLLFKLAIEAIMFPLLLAIIYSLYMVFVMFFAFVGQLFSLIIFKFKMTLKEACRLMMVASTPQIAVLSLLLTAKIILPNWGLFCVALWSLYFSYAVLAVRKDCQKMVKT